MIATTAARKIRTFRCERTGALVVVQTGQREKVLGEVVPFGSAFRAQTEDGTPLALKSLESQAVAWFKYAS